MTTVWIQLAEQEHARLLGLAEQLQMAPEELAGLALGHALLDEDEIVEQFINQIVTKNEELYRRLA